MMNKGILFALPLVGIAAGAEAKLERPNVILIYMDDMGYGDLGVTGASLYETPNIDRMAREGMLFTKFYTPATMSSASRLGLMTGCYPERVGTLGVLMPGSRRGINPQEEIIPELMKAAGYRTAMVGKWHLGDAPEFRPTAQGFDEFYGLLYSNDMWPYSGSKRGETNPKVTKKLPPLYLKDGDRDVREIARMKDQDELTTLYTERAVEFIERNSSQPFFLYFAHAMPHIPLAVSDKFRGKSELGEYGDVMMEVDWSIGELIKALKRKKIDSNTLIIFTSDNGPWIKFGNASGSAGAMREGKFCVQEGGQHMFCIMRWPEMIREGAICNRLAATIDILPTLVEVTSGTMPREKIDGVSLLPLMKGESVWVRDFYVYGGLNAIRNHRYKLIAPHTYRSNQVAVWNPKSVYGIREVEITDYELYDLRHDPGEHYNIASKFPDIVEELKAELEKYRTQIGPHGNERREAGVRQDK